jgi:hypothetical protein
MASDTIKGITEVFPEDFFNISQPDTPIVQIQVRSNFTGPINDANNWTEVHLKPGMTNYFNTMTVEDAGGMQRVTATFFDKNFANVENAIIKSLVLTKAANELANIDTVGDDTGYFEFKVDNQVMTNFRIRFGYSEVMNETGKAPFIDDSDFTGSDFSNRMNSGKTVVRSPWIYLQMIGTKFDLRDEGLFAEISAFSVMDSFLSKAKLLRRFAVLRGTPKDVIKSICEIIKKASAEGSFDYEFIGEEPITLATEGGNGDIEINLGSQVDDTRRSYRNINSIFSEVMGKIPNKIYDEKDANQAGENAAESVVEASKIVPYRYSVRQEINGGKLKTIIEFKYPDPIVQQQTSIRTYIWKEYGQSIVKNLSVSSQVDFAALNTQVFTVDHGENIVNLSVASPSTSTQERDSESSTHLHDIKDVTEALKKDDYSFTFVSNSIGVDGGGQSTIGARIASNVVYNLNQGVFKGTIEIPGDPFYLFDSKMSPYQYLIKILVQRPGYIDANDKFEGLSVSYLSGYYGVSKITHNINASGFSTILEVTRWPIEG